MPTATLAKSSTPISTLSSMTQNHTATAVQSGPYTKAQFQSTIEGSRTIKTSKEVEQLLRDYPAALELYRTGKYKVKVKYEADVERVILVEKRTIKHMPSNSTTTTNDNQENNQTVPDLSINTEQDNENKNQQDSRQSRSRTHSRDRIAPTTSSEKPNDNFVHTTISSIRMTSNTQPKVDHQRTPSKDREVSVTPQQKQFAHQRSQSRDSQHKVSYNQQQEKKIHRDYQKPMVPYVSNPGNLWQQQKPYFSNPVLQQQQQQQPRSNVYVPPSFVPQQNPLYQQSYYFGQRPTIPPVYQPQQSAYPTLLTGPMGKQRLHSTNNYSLSSRSASNNMALPPSFRTFHSNQQQILSFRSMYQSQMPIPTNRPWPNMPNDPLSASMMNNHNAYIEQHRGAKHRARSVDPGPRNYPSVGLSNVQQQPVALVEHYHYHHHRHRPNPTNNVNSAVENEKEQNVSFKKSTNLNNIEKLTVRQLNETFAQTDPSGRLSYNLIPSILQRFGITLTENDIISAAKELGYNTNEPISARRLVHVLVKLGKITKSSHPPRQGVSPSILPEDREVKDIMTQRKATAPQTQSTYQPYQWR